jgi:hypothetical protein
MTLCTCCHLASHVHMVYQSAVRDKAGGQCAVCPHNHDVLRSSSTCQQDKELKAMAAKFTKLVASLHDIEVLAMAVKSDAAASCKVSSN